MDSVSALAIAKRVLTADLSCEEGDLDKEKTTINIAREIDGARRFPLRKNSLNIATFGKGVVISCNTNRLQWVETNLKGRTRDDIFNPSVFTLIEKYISRDSQVMVGPDLKYICADDTYHELKPIQNVELHVVFGDGIEVLYGDKRFRNALGDEHNPKRPRVVAVTAISSGEIVGIAAASADSAQMYQVGIDVLPDFRNQGIGTALVSKLTKSVLDMEKVPYYTTWANNIASRRLAINVGFRPAWVESYAMNKDERSRSS